MKQKKKYITALICAAVILFLTVNVTAAQTQNDIYTAINNAREWMEKNSSPFSRPDAPSSDYYMMALSRLGAEYDYKKFVSYTEARKPVSVKDGQRLILTATACGGSPASVKNYTYDVKQFNDISELAGAIITLDSGKYEVRSKKITKDQLAAQLLASQQPNGSFGADDYTTALSVIALTPYSGIQYKLTGNHESNIITYNTFEALNKAMKYLKQRYSDAGGFSSLRTNAHFIIALDYAGIDADNDSEFIAVGNSPLGHLLSHQLEDGSFNRSADDTALALCAMTSHLRAMQNKSRFFDFHESDTLEAASNINYSSQGLSVNPNELTEIEVKSLSVTHKNDGDEYGPFMIMGPDSPEDTQLSSEQPQPTQSAEEQHNNSVLIAIMIAFLCLICIFAYIALRSKLLQIANKKHTKAANAADDIHKTDDKTK